MCYYCTVRQQLTNKGVHMSNLKLDQTASPKSPKSPNRQTIGKLKNLVKRLGEMQEAYAKEENSLTKNAIIKQAFSAYSGVMDNLSKFYKGGDSAVEQLKAEARKPYEFFKKEIDNRYPTLLLADIPQTAEEQSQYEEDVRKGVQRTYVALQPKSKVDERRVSPEKSALPTPKKPVTVEQTPVVVEQTPVVDKNVEAQVELKRKVEAKLAPIFKALNDLELKLDSDNAKFRSPETKVAAKAIHEDWVKAAKAYETALLEAKGDVDAGKNFNQALSDAMTKDGRKALMDKDISWGDYFKDVFKMLANAVIGMVNVFKSNPYSFYQYAKPEASVTVESAVDAMRVN